MKRTDQYPQPGRFARYLGVLVCIGAMTAFALDPQKTITQYRHRSWGAADGLDGVYSIAQTTDGYIWVGAANGLFRFDGFHFKPWEPGPNEPKLPAHASLLLGTKDGSLWIASVGHMLRLKEGHLTDSPLPGASQGCLMYNRIQERRDGTLWVPTSFGLFEFVQGKWRKIELPTNFKDPAVAIDARLLIDSRDTVWVGIASWSRDRNPDEARLLFLRSGESHFQTVFEPMIPFLDLAESPDGRIWLGQDHGRPRILEDDGRSPCVIGGDVPIRSLNLLFDHDGSLWTALQELGVRRLARASLLATNALLSSKLDELSVNFTPSDGLTSDIQGPIFQDREGNVWVGTTSGLDCFSETKITRSPTGRGFPMIEAFQSRLRRMGLFGRYPVSMVLKK